MAATFFDTHAHVKQLQAAGFPEMQAEATIKAISDIMADQIATKYDLKELELKTDAKFSEVNKNISDSKFSIICWIVGIFIAQASLILSIILKVLHIY